MGVAYAQPVEREPNFDTRQELALAIVAEAMGTLELPRGLDEAIRDHLTDALLAHPKAQSLLRRAMEDPHVDRTDEVVRAGLGLEAEDHEDPQEGTG